VTEHRSSAEKEGEEAAALDVAMEGEKGGGPGARIPLAAMEKSSRRWR
jgi:hypothetical protein